MGDSNTSKVFKSISGENVCVKTCLADMWHDLQDTCDVQPKPDAWIIQLCIHIKESDAADMNNSTNFHVSFEIQTHQKQLQCF